MATGARAGWVRKGTRAAARAILGGHEAADRLPAWGVGQHSRVSEQAACNPRPDYSVRVSAAWKGLAYFMSTLASRLSLQLAEKTTPKCCRSLLTTVEACPGRHRLHSVHNVARPRQSYHFLRRRMEHSCRSCFEAADHPSAADRR